MKCPHCLDSFHPELTTIKLYKGEEGFWSVLHQQCPGCKKFILFVDCSHGGWNYPSPALHKLVHPKAPSRNAISTEVTNKTVVSDYNEAALVLTDSPKASAALSRRCLQCILREKAGITHGDLSSEIQQVLDSGKLPTEIAENLDAIRNIGNFAAHPNKSTHSGEVLDVEPDEAEWNLEVLEQLIDFYYTRPAIAKKKREDLNTKLASAGKPPIKSQKDALEKLG